jgi:hypothetical protein
MTSLESSIAALRDACRVHNRNPAYRAAGYPPIAPYVATIAFTDGRPPYRRAFNATLDAAEARARFYTIDANARLAVIGRLTIEVRAAK